jgi:small-conductance mechanosensitive channel
MPSRNNNRERTSGSGISRRFLSTRNPGNQSPVRRPALRRRVKKRAVQGKAVKGAQNQLKRFRQGSILAVAVTGFLLLLLTPGEAGYSTDEPVQEKVEADSADRSEGEAGLQVDLPDSVAIIENIAVEDLLNAGEEAAVESAQKEEAIAKATRNEAVETFRNLWEGFYSNLPKILVAIATLLIAWLLIRLLKFIMGRTFKRKPGMSATVTLIQICAWFFAIGLAISVVAGDIRALVGSLGLIGLALSWSLQTPIESFTGWLLNSFRGYYRVGDRISVGDVFGDVYKIDFLTTTVWEIGAPFRSGFVQAEQPTGRLVTFPNNEVLSGVVINLTGDFPHVWDELAIGVANESDIPLAMQVLEKAAIDLLGDYMKEPANEYHKALKRRQMDYSVPDKPQVFISVGESWTDIIIRYLVGARERRKWKSELSLRVIKELNKHEYKDKIIPVYPRHQVQMIDEEGKPVNKDV